MYQFERDLSHADFHDCHFPERSDRYESRIYRSGEVGFSLGKYLKENGVEITGYFSKSPESAKSAADFTNTKLYKSIENILSDSDTLFITVPDGQISKVWDYMKNLDIKNKNICHCSGSISSTVFF